MPDFFIYWDAEKSVKYSLASKVNARGAPKQPRRKRSDDVPFGIFPCNIRGWSGLELSLTCRQDDFAEDLSEGEIKTQASGTS
jgi:hypothetical protein